MEFSIPIENIKDSELLRLIGVSRRIDRPLYRPRFAKRVIIKRESIPIVLRANVF